MLKSSSYVGRVSLGSIQVTIRPKIRGVFFLNLLGYAYGLRNLKLYPPAGYDSGADSFQDLLISGLAEEVEELLSRGLYRRYERKDDNLAEPRGRINLQALAARGGVVQATLPCIHYLRVENCPLNQVLLAGLQMAARQTTDMILSGRLRRLASLFAVSVSPVIPDRNMLAGVMRETDRLTASCLPALNIIDILMQAGGVSLADGPKKVAVPGFLFDMNRFFQVLLSRFLKENLPGYDVKDEYGLKGMMDYLPGFYPRVPRPAPKPRPDYVVMKGGKTVAVLDAKYRDLWELELPGDILYQLAVYALSQGDGGRAVVLYPSTGEAREVRIGINDPLSGSNRAQVILRPVDMPELGRLIAGKGSAVERRRRELAGRLVFGDGGF